MSHLTCKINLSPHYLWCPDDRVVSTSDSESVGLGSIPGGRVSNFFLLFFLLEVNKLFSFFLFISKLIDTSK